MDHGQSDMSQTDTMANHGGAGASPDRSGDIGAMGMPGSFSKKCEHLHHDLGSMGKWSMILIPNGKGRSD